MLTTIWEMWPLTSGMFEEAKPYFQEALDIFITFNDQYAQAGYLPPVGCCRASIAWSMKKPVITINEL